LALQVTGSDGLNVLYCRWHRTIRHTGQSAAKEC